MKYLFLRVQLARIPRVLQLIHLKWRWGEGLHVARSCDHGGEIPVVAVTVTRRHVDVQMEPASVLGLQTRLSKKPALEKNDTVALTAEQQQALNQHKVV